MPEAQDDSNQSSSHFRGCGQKQERNFRRNVGKSNHRHKNKSQKKILVIHHDQDKMPTNEA